MFSLHIDVTLGNFGFIQKLEEINIKETSRLIEKEGNILIP